MSYQKQRITPQQSRPTVQHLRTVRRVIKTPDDVDGPRPGAYDMRGRAHGEVPDWIQNPRPRNQILRDPSHSHILISDAEVILPNEQGIPEAEQIIAATVVLENRIGMHGLRNAANPGATMSLRRRNPTEFQEPESRIVPTASDRSHVPPENTVSPQSLPHRQSGLQNTSNPAGGQRHSVRSLLEEDEDEYVAQDRFVQGMQSARMPADRAQEIDVDHPHVISVLEVFPDASVKRIMGLLRQESLATTFIILAEESSAEPSDDVAYPTELQHATTYAQATDEGRAMIMSYLVDMFPHIGQKKIENVLMKYSTHNGVALLSEVGSNSQPYLPKKVPPVAARRESLIDDDEDEYEIRHPPLPWMQQQPELDRKQSPAYMKNGTNTYNSFAAASKAPDFVQRRSRKSPTGIFEMVMKESQQDAVLEQERFASERKKTPPRRHVMDNRKTGRSCEEFDILKPKGAHKNAFYDLKSLK